MSGHVVESTSELSAFMKAGVMAGSERDTGFSSGGDEDDMSGLHSPSASEDSVEVQVTPISLRNKRKLAEPRKIQEPNTAPLKKRRFEQIEETAVPDEESRRIRSPSPFRPWSTSSKANEPKTLSGTTPTSTSASTTSPTAVGSSVPARTPSTASADLLERSEEVWRNREARIQEGFPPRLERPESPAGCPQNSHGQRRESPRQKLESAITSVAMSASGTAVPTSAAMASLPLGHPRLQEEPLSLVLRGEIARVPSHPAVSGCYERASSAYSMDHANVPSSSPGSSSHHHQNHRSGSSASTVSNGQTNHSRQHQTAGGQQRNYKNMTRERRIEANARERTRVHTISAAFDTLRRAIPAYSHNQKLSKLSVLRIACSYIMTLGKIVNTPEGQSTNDAALGACVDLVSRTIQTEGKLRKRKED